MTFRQPGYSTDNYNPEPTPRPDWVQAIPERVLKSDADAKAHRSLRRGMLAGAVIFGALGFWAGAALAATQCDTRERVVALLADKYGETLRLVGLAGGNSVMGLWASDATGTWTITLTLATGEMCLMASGAGFETVPVGEPT